MTERDLTVAVLAHTDDGPVAHRGTTGRMITHSAPYPMGTHILTWMERVGVDQTWYHGDIWGPWDDDDDPDPPGWTLGPHSDVWRVYYHQGVYGARELAVPWEDARSPWRTAKSPLGLLQGLLLYARHVGPWRWGPGATGTRLMRETYPHAAPCGNLPDAPRRGLVEGAPQWCRRLDPDELGPGTWIHAWDKNAMYLAACAGLDLGVGDCEHRSDDLRAYAVGARDPGYYRVAIAADPGGLIPALLGGAHGWITAPTLKLLTDTRADFALDEAYVWPARARALAPWEAHLARAREALMARDDAPGRLALAALKSTYNEATGWIAHHAPRPAGRDDGPALPAHRAVWGGAPDWLAQIRAAAHANLWRNVARMAPRPFGADAIDTVYTLGGAEPAAPEGMRVGAGMGEWKRKASLPVAGPWRDRLLAADAAERLAALGELAAAMREGARHAEPR